MILYFAGCDVDHYAEKLRAVGAESGLCSAYYLNYEREPNRQGFSRFLVDSGGYTIRKTGQTIDVKRYADYLARYDVDFAFNLDTLDFDESMENQRRLEELAPRTYIIPVYHYADWAGTKWRDTLERLSGEYPFISIAGLGAASVPLRRKFYEHCFSVVRNKVRVHGLGATRSEDMLDFPFYSVDSTSYVYAQKAGTWFVFENGGVKKYQSARVLAQRTKPKLKNANVLGYEPYRFIAQAARAYMEFAEYATRYWAQRGVTWDDFRNPRR